MDDAVGVRDQGLLRGVAGVKEDRRYGDAGAVDFPRRPSGQVGPIEDFYGLKPCWRASSSFPYSSPGNQELWTVSVNMIQCLL
jgi:hypothetical protein